VSRRKFIDLAEEIGVIQPLGKIFLRKACGEVRRLQIELPIEPALTLCTNLMASQLIQKDLLDNIASILRECEFAPDHLSLEITDSVFFEQQERAVDLLAKIHDLGIDLKVGNFGTGYSNLSYLTRLPVSSLKIDRTFVRDIRNCSDPARLARAVAMLARNLQLKVVAEGVETSGQLEVLQTLGCDSAQGGLFGEPMTYMELRDFLLRGEANQVSSLGFGEVTMLPVMQ
jgi:EAL domain-containing protein (putative c-di-GMP-specific phosphodiesterase class I)